MNDHNLSEISKKIRIVDNLNLRCSFELSNQNFISLPYMNLDEILLLKGGQTIELRYHENIVKITGFRLRALYLQFHRHFVETIEITHKPLEEEHKRMCYVTDIILEEESN